MRLLRRPELPGRLAMTVPAASVRGYGIGPSLFQTFGAARSTAAPTSKNSSRENPNRPAMTFEGRTSQRVL